MNKKISVIVPIYNSEKYLAECIQSIIAQTYKNLEILLINDGSNDTSLSICQEFQKKDARIRVIDKMNEGISATRNRGIDEASGDYIGFVDSDDTIKDNMYEVMKKKLDEYSVVDFVTCAVEMVYPDGEKKYPVQQEQSAVLYDNLQYRKLVYLEKTNIACWSKLYRSSFLKRYRFKTGITNEDFVILYEMTQNDLKVLALNDILYCYIVRQGSLSSTVRAYHDGVKNAYVAMEREEKSNSLIEEARSLFFIQSDYFLSRFCNEKNNNTCMNCWIKKELRKRIMKIITNCYLYKKQRLRLVWRSFFY